MGYFTRITASSSSGNTSSTSDQVLFTAGATGVQSRTDTSDSRVTMAVTGDVSCTGKLHINEIEADLVCETSDPRKKTGMRNMTDQEAYIALQIEPKMYELKTRPGQLHAGVDAFETEKVASHAVSRSKKGDLAVNYRMISMHTLKLVQQMHAELEELKRKQQHHHSAVVVS